ncbi:MAG: ZIP family metal transporter [archaeon]
MSLFLQAFLGGLLVLLATSLGAVIGTFARRVKKCDCYILLSFAAGVMAFSVYEMSLESLKKSGAFASFVGSAVGFLIFFLIERLLPHTHLLRNGSEKGRKKTKTFLLLGAIAIHNIPEGLAVGSAFAGSAVFGWFVSSSIAIQDIPEGLLITAPLIIYGLSTRKSLFYGILSGVSETAAAIVGFIFLSRVSALVPFALAFSSGAMTYVILVELLPDALSEEGKKGRTVFSFILGIFLTWLLASLLGVSAGTGVV